MPTPMEGRRLDSWKEIAAYFERRVRTVQRWEKSEGLPVHRHQHEKGSSVYAFTAELDAWWTRRSAPSVPPPPEPLEPAAPPPLQEILEAPPLPPPRPGFRRAAVLLPIAALCALLVLVRPPAGERRPLSAALGDRETTAAESFRKGQSLLHRGNREALRESLAWFAHAARLDPDSPRAWAALAEAYNRSSDAHILPPREAFAQAKAAATRAIRLAPDLAEAHAALAHATMIDDWDLETAERSYRRALALDPSSAFTHYGYARLLSAAGRAEEALAEVRRAQEIEPDSLLIAALQADIWLRARRYPEAIRFCRGAIEAEEGFQQGYICLRDAYILSDQPARAWEAFADLARQTGRSRLAASWQEPDPGASLRNGIRGLLDWWHSLEPTSYFPPYRFAYEHAALGEVEMALSWLERGVAEHDRTLLFLPVDPMFDVLRGNPRYAALLHRAGLEPRGGDRIADASLTIPEPP